MNETNCYLILPGAANFAVRYAVNADGKMEARDFLWEELLGKYRNIRAFNRFKDLWELYSKEGHIPGENNFRPLADSDGIYELKEHSGPFRLYCFKSYNRELVLTHGEKKANKNKVNKAVIKKAKRIRNEDGQYWEGRNHV